MKFNAVIFVEGDSDQKFIHDLVKSKFDCELEIGKQIQIVQGKDSLHLFKPDFILNTEQALTNLVIFDANGSMDQRTTELNSKKAELGIQFDLFLLPNGRDNGDLEVLLERITVEKNRRIFECFDVFTQCLGKLNMDLDIPDRKTKIYSYTNLLRKDPRPSKRNYLDSQLWDLNSPHLEQLYNFLLPYFSKNV